MLCSLVSRFGFSRYMRLDRPKMKRKSNAVRGVIYLTIFFKNFTNIPGLSIHSTHLMCICLWQMLDFGFHGRQSVLDEVDAFDNEAFQREKEAILDQIDNVLLPDYGDDYDDYAKRSKRKLFSLVMQENNTLNPSDTRLHVDQFNRSKEVNDDPQPQPELQKPAVGHQGTTEYQRSLQQNQTKTESPVKKVKQVKPKGKRPRRRQKVKSVETNLQSIPVVRERLKGKERAVPSENLNSEQHQMRRSHRTIHTQIQRLKNSETNTALPEKPTADMQRSLITRQAEIDPITKKHLTTQKRVTSYGIKQKVTYKRKHLRHKAEKISKPLQHDSENSIHKSKAMAKGKTFSHTNVDEDEVYNTTENKRANRDSHWGREEDNDEDVDPPLVFDTEVYWNQTFQVNPLDFQTMRSDWIDLQCNVSGNLLLQSSDALDVVKDFMDQLNKKHNGYVMYSVLYSASSES